MFRKSLMKNASMKTKKLKLKGLGEKGGFENGLLNPDLLATYSDGQSKSVGISFAKVSITNLNFLFK